MARKSFKMGDLDLLEELGIEEEDDDYDDGED